MPVNALPTPNPNAMKFAVGSLVGGPKTYVAGSATDDPVASALLGIPGVASIFMTADFVTITKSPEASWQSISADAVSILENHFAD